MPNPAQLQKIRDYATSLPEQDRKKFISKFNEIKGDEGKISTLTDRISKISPSSQEKAPYEGIQKQNALGKTFNVPAATTRAAIRSNPALAVAGPFAGSLATTGIAGKEAQRAAIGGALNPNDVETFQSEFIRKAQTSTSTMENFKRGFIPSAKGLAADFITNPGEIGLILATGGIGKAISLTKAGQAVGIFLNKKRSIIKPKNIRIDKIIDTSINKSIRPSVIGKTNANQTEKYYENAREAVKTIINNKQSLQFTTEEGQVVNKLPGSLNEFSQAIAQSKRNLFNQYDTLAQQTSGTNVNLNNVIKTLDDISTNKVLKIKNPQIGKYANDLKMRLSKSNLTPSQTQDLIESFNSDLKAFYKNPDYNSASKATVDAAVANNLRSSLDKHITSLTGENYQILKNQYGSLSAIEKDVNHRAIVDARKNVKGLLDFTDIFSVGDIVRGVGNLDPGNISKGVVQTAIKAVFKKMNDPNHIIKGMFKKVDKLNFTNTK